MHRSFPGDCALPALPGRRHDNQHGCRCHSFIAPLSVTNFPLFAQHSLCSLSSFSGVFFLLLSCVCPSFYHLSISFNFFFCFFWDFWPSVPNKREHSSWCVCVCVFMGSKLEGADLGAAPKSTKTFWDLFFFCLHHERVREKTQTLISFQRMCVLPSHDPSLFPPSFPW